MRLPLQPSLSCSYATLRAELPCRAEPPASSKGSAFEVRPYRLTTGTLRGTAAPTVGRTDVVDLALPLHG